MMSTNFQIPEEMKAYVLNVGYDTKSGQVVVTVSSKLFFQEVLRQQQSQSPVRFNITGVLKNNEKIFVYVLPDVRFTDPFEGFEGRFVISQSKLEEMIYKQAPVKIYYKQEDNDLLMLLYVSVDLLKGVKSGQGEAKPGFGW